MIEFKYKPDGQVIKDFMKDNTFFRGIRGPVGSGKSVACSIEIFRRALMQEKDKNGKRKSRWAIIRNTNPQLRTTTIKTWLDWFPENEWGKFMWSVPYTHFITQADLEMEVIFLALDRPEDVKKLLSLELTGVWVNEAREIPKSIIDACTMRVGRYPSVKDGAATWSGVICDTNSPEEDHWWSIMSGEVPVPDHITLEESRMLVKPDNWRFFTQPSGMLEEKDEDNAVIGYKPNKDAENRKNILETYAPKLQTQTIEDKKVKDIISEEGSEFENLDLSIGNRKKLSTQEKVIEPISFLTKDQTSSKLDDGIFTNFIKLCLSNLFLY